MFKIDDIKSLDGREFAMLSRDDRAMLDFFIAQGRKYGVTLHVITTASRADLEHAASLEQANEILRRARSKIVVRTSDDDDAVGLPDAIMWPFTRTP